jgi:hypothetical protein
MKTLNSQSTGLPHDPELEESRAYFSEGSTQDNTENDDASGDLVLEHHQHERHAVDPPAMNGTDDADQIENEEMGIEVEHFSNRADAWAVWARQFATGLRGTTGDDDRGDHVVETSY